MIETVMRELYTTLSEKDRRRYAATEALKLGHGGQTYIASVLGCCRKTIQRGLAELNRLSEIAAAGRIRRPGGGRKACTVTQPDLDTQFLAVLRDHTAGDPMREEVVWTDLRPAEIQARLQQDYGTAISIPIVRQLLKKHHYRRRRARKRQTRKSVPQRNAQFENIAILRAVYELLGNPVLSMDTKKKEALGNLYRDGHLYTQTVLETYDHDFPSYAEGRIIPHGIYDLRHQRAYIHLGTSHDTSAFACDSLRVWWYSEGRERYPTATSILILCDGGGSNNARHYLFKRDVQLLADEIGVEIRIAHYPPYCSKYNPIEHRVFPHVTRACQGVIFTSIALVKDLMAKTTTKTGLTVRVQIIDKLYATKRTVAEHFKQHMPIVFDDYLPLWNYRAVPRRNLNGTLI
jgi:hypothetical protein